jgi:hypothetical protein
MLEGLLVGDIVDKQSALSAAIMSRCDGSVTFAASYDTSEKIEGPVQVSQICALTLAPSRSVTVLKANSTPIVGLVLLKTSLMYLTFRPSFYRNKIFDFPTPESPVSTTKDGWGVYPS